MKIEVNIESVHKTSYTITMHDKKYTEVKLHIPKDKAERPTVAPGNPWYIWFRWYNEKTGKKDIQFRFKRGINRKKTVQERKQVGEAYVKTFQILLDKGWNPTTNKLPTKSQQRKSKNFTVKSAIKYALELKSEKTKESTYKDYEHRADVFLRWAVLQWLHRHLSRHTHSLSKANLYLNQLALYFQNKKHSNKKGQNHSRKWPRMCYQRNLKEAFSLGLSLPLVQR